MRILRRVSLVSLLLVCLLWPQLSVPVTNLPEGPTGDPTCSDLRDNNRDGSRDAADAGCAASLPFAACATGFCAEAADGVLVSPMAVASDEDTDGTVDVVTLPFNADYSAAKACYGIDEDFTGYIWARVKGTGAIWVTIAGDTGHGGTPHNQYMTKVSLTGYDYVPIGLRVDSNYQREAIEGDLIQRQFVIDGDPTPKQLCVAITPGLSFRALYRNTSSTVTPILPTVDEPAPLVNYGMFELGANPAPTVDSTVWEQADSAVWGGTGFDLPLSAPATMKMVYKEGSPDRIYIRWEKTLANQDWTDVATDSTTIASYTAAIAYLKMDSLVRAPTDQLWILAASPQPDYYDATGPGGTFTVANNLANVAVTTSVSGNRRRIQMAFDAPANISAGLQFLCGFRDNERVVGNTLKYQYAFNADPTLPHLGLCQASGTIITPADTTAPTVSSTVIDCPNSGSCNVTVSGSDNASSSMTVTLQVGTATGTYTLATQGPITTTGLCTSSCTALFNLSGLSAGTTYYVLATMRDQAGNTDDGSEANDTTAVAGTTFYISTGGSGTTCSNGSPCAISALARTTGSGRPAPGETWLIKDGTYSPVPTINCGAGVRNGTPSQKITVRAENERLARISSNSATIPFLSFISCTDWNIEGITFFASATNTNTEEKLLCNGCARMGIRRNLFVHGPRKQVDGSIAGTVLLWASDKSGIGSHIVEDNECYGDVRYCMITKYESNSTFRRNYANNRTYTTPADFIDIDNNDNKMDAAITIYPGNNHLIEDHISENNSTALNNESGPSGFHSSGNRAFGNISLNDWYGQKIAPHSGTLISNWVIRDLLVVNATRIPLSLQSNVNTDVAHFSIFATAAASNGVNAPITASVNPTNLSIYLRDGLIHGPTSKKGFLISLGGVYDDFALNRSRLFGNTGTTPTSHANITNITTSDPQMGTARVCIPTNSNLKGAASDGGDIGANVLYRYQGGVKNTANKRWVTTKPASCPTNVSGIYPYGMGACVAGLNNTVSDSLVGIADRLGMTISQVEGSSTGQCNAGSSYFP
jgi:hypothetical protein